MTSKYTRAAKGEPCLVRIPGVCNHLPETTVFAHLNGGGMGMKRADIHGAYACSDCHDALDRRVDVGLQPRELLLYHLDGMIRTQELMIARGVLIL